MGCEPWLSPGRDCARSAARHGVLLGVRVRQLRATGAPQSEKNRTLRGSAAYLPTSLVCPKIAHPALSHGVPQVRTRSERIACVSWLSPCRDCARSAARHGFLWVSTSDSSAPQALRNRLKKIARSAALLHICRLRWCVRKSRILRYLMVSRRCVREVRESRVYLGYRRAVTAHAPRLVTGSCGCPRPTAPRHRHSAIG